jgi:formylglycine-generating enzyme required for sulfatase activity
LAALILRETANSERATSHTVDLRQLNDYYREHGEFPAQSVLDTMTAPAPAVEAPIGEPIQIALSWQDFGGSGTLTLPGDLNMDFVRVEPGRVQLRENTDPAGGASLGSFSITAGYWIGRVEVTAAQWQAVMMDNHQVTVASTTFEIASLRDLTVPVNNVSWNDCQRFLAKLNSGGAGRFRLPYETEWEFATRATATTTWHFGENEESLGRFAWWAGNSGGSIQSVGRLNPNAWGLFDMHGNVAEWCQDSVGGAERMLRGGAWSTESPLQLSSAHRESADADTVSGSIGFRCVRDL